jgi:superfamily II DNA helicase RecQ
MAFFTTAVADDAPKGRSAFTAREEEVVARASASAPLCHSGGVNTQTLNPLDTLHRIFGFSGFRGVQQDVVERVLGANRHWP